MEKLNDHKSILLSELERLKVGTLLNRFKLLKSNFDTGANVTWGFDPGMNAALIEIFRQPMANAHFAQILSSLNINVPLMPEGVTPLILSANTTTSRQWITPFSNLDFNGVFKPQGYYWQVAYIIHPSIPLGRQLISTQKNFAVIEQAKGRLFNNLARIADKDKLESIGFKDGELTKTLDYFLSVTNKLI